MEISDIVSLTGAVLSLFGYIGTITTYAVFEELRNIPGFCLLNALVALLISAIICVSSQCVLFNGISCVAIAIIQQLSILAAFSWMSLQAVHMVRSFVLTNWQTPLGHLSNRTQYRVSLSHALIGWGLPTIYTAVLLYLHFCHNCFPGDSEFRFGRDVNSTSGSCWPGQTNPSNNLSTYPILILLAFNIVALLSIMIAIIRKRMVTRKAAGRDLRKEMATNLLILAKLSVSLGATWTPVLVHQFLHYPLLLQIHEHISTWLGVIIFTLFATSPRIRRFWREKLSGFYPKKPNETPSDLYKLKDSSGSGRNF